MNIARGRTHERARALRMTAISLSICIALLGAHGAAMRARASEPDPPREVHVGETLRLQMPGPKVGASMAFEILADATGPITIDARTLDFDIALEVARIDSLIEHETVGKDDNGGAASNARLIVDVAEGARYRITVLCLDEDLTGEFELQVSAGRAEALEFKAAQEADLAYWQAIEDRARAQGDKPREGIGLNGRATILQERGAYAEAKVLFERALSLFEDYFGPDDRNTAAAVNNLALLLQVMGSYEEAKPLFERCLSIWEKGDPEDPDVATALHNLAIIQQSLGAYDEARALYERALAIRELRLGPSEPVVASTLVALAVVFQAQGLFVEAKPLLERALAIREEKLGPEHPSVANCLTALATLQGSLGDYAGAKRLLERAVTIREKQLGTEHPLFAKTLNTLASLLARKHEHEEAKRLLERSLAISEKQLGPEHPEVLQTRADIADLFVRMGLYAVAESLHTLSLAIREEKFGPEHPSVVANLASLAAIARARGDYAKAEMLYARVLATHEKLLGAEHPEVARDLTSLAQVFALNGRTSEALSDALRAEELGRNHLRLTARALSERQALQYASVRVAGLDLALSVTSPDDPQGVRKTWDSLVRSRALVLDEMAARHRTLASASDPEIAALERKLASASARFANLMVRGPARDPVDRYRALLDDARRQKEEEEEALAGRSATFRRMRASEAAGLDAVARALPSKCALVAFVLYDRYAVADVAPAGSDALAHSPDDDAAPRAPVPFYAAFVLPAGAAEPVALSLGPAEQIDALVARWQTEAATGVLDRGRSPEAAEALCRRYGVSLKERIWDAVASHLGGAERVFVVPDGALNLVSFAALPVGDGRYLVEAGPTVHYLSAERDLVDFATDAAPHARGVGLLAVGGPAFDESAKTEKGGGSVIAGAPPSADLAAPASPFRGARSNCSGFESVRFEPLPASVQEVDEIASLWNATAAPPGRKGEGGAHVLTGASAGEAAFKREAPGRRVLHLATHGFFLGGECKSALDATRGIGMLTEQATATPAEVAGENPLHLSGLALAGANRRDVVFGDQDDGILTAEEIAALDLLGAEWVVLSACESGVGDVHAGEGVVGLRRAFQVAGAGTLITSLWSVDDQSTREWMKSLYEGRLGRNLDTAESVGRASLDVLQARRARGLVTHPFYWAAFVAAGDWR